MKGSSTWEVGLLALELWQHEALIRYDSHLDFQLPELWENMCVSMENMALAPEGIMYSLF